MRLLHLGKAHRENTKALNEDGMAHRIEPSALHVDGLRHSFDAKPHREMAMAHREETMRPFELAMRRRKERMAHPEDAIPHPEKLGRHPVFRKPTEATAEGVPAILQRHDLVPTLRRAAAKPNEGSHDLYLDPDGTRTRKRRGTEARERGEPGSRLAVCTPLPPRSTPLGEGPAHVDDVRRGARASPGRRRMLPVLEHDCRFPRLRAHARRELASLQQELRSSDLRESLRIHEGQGDFGDVTWLPCAQRLGSLTAIDRVEPGVVRVLAPVVAGVPVRAHPQVADGR